ncbi:MauE/DoxX family redox-associated membrane protein [Pedobacter africanus]|uniref:Methylamine utilisation protein MauE domain-containing protein n=1 Tax=Pedobacter africanus TaxID=151894 RepID=A0A1W2A2R9_9SPHI|nr:hypothetical protein SAMN04488524_1163 [Pedobacter africanus]
MNLHRITLISSLLLATLLLYASGIKLWSYAKSKIGFEFFPFVKEYHELVFWLLMTFQLVFAGLLFSNRTRLIGLYGVFFLLSFLGSYLYVMIHFSNNIPCFCTGVIPFMSWNGHLWFTISFAVLAGIMIVLFPDKNIHARG